MLPRSMRSASQLWRRGPALLCHRQTACSAAEPPGPPRLPILGNLHNFDVGQLTQGDMRPLYARYGPIVGVNIMGQSLVFLSDVDMAREVLKDGADRFRNGDQFRAVFGALFPTSVIVVEGEQWQRVRRVLMRAMQNTSVERMIRPVDKICNRAAGTFKPNEACDVHRLFSNITFDAFGVWAYGIEMNMVAGENRTLLEACEEVAGTVSRRITKEPLQLLWRLPTRRNRRSASALRQVREHAQSLLAVARARLEKKEKAENFLEALVQASLAEGGAKLTDQELEDNMSTVFFGAYETSSATLSFTLDFLAGHQGAQERLREELDGLDLGELTMEQLAGLRYLDAVAKEAHRMRSTAWAFPRTAITDTQVGGYLVKAGAQVLIDHNGLTARDPELWGGQGDLDEFRPERWWEARPHGLASLPFGFGGRSCPGRRVANLQQRLVTAQMVQRLRWRRDASRPLELGSGIGLQPKGGCWLVPERW